MPPENLFEKLAAETGVAIVTVDKESSVASVNNNSICRHLYSSEEFAPRCEQFCGRAFEMAVSTGKAVPYCCHAGLDCLAVPVKAEERQLVVIVGRTFTKAENYRRATERAISGDWTRFPTDEFFENVLVSGSYQNLEQAARRLEKLSVEDKRKVSSLVAPQAPVSDELPAKVHVEEEAAPKLLREEEMPTHSMLEPFEQDRPAPGVEEPRAGDQTPLPTEAQRWIDQLHTRAAESAGSKTAKNSAHEKEEIAAWRSLLGSLFDLSYREACRAVMQFLAKRYGLSSLAWLKREENRFKSILAIGSLEDQSFQIGLVPDDGVLREAVQKGISLKMRRRTKTGETARPQLILLFPIAVGGEVQSALVIGDEIREEALKRHISRFCQTVASELEILRLREEVKRRDWLAGAVEKFNQNLKNIDSEDFWLNLTQISAELLRAERSSLLVFDEKTDALRVKAAIGATANNIKNKTQEIGDRIARVVLHRGKPIVVEDIAETGLPAAPPDWKYRSNSFISYPFVIGERKIGVLNVTEKADGAPYSAIDLELLEAIAPQVALMIDRATLKNKAGEYEQLSVTDALTGLLNRRYLEERLTEEVKRSNRYGYPVSFLMIDVDRFKNYNDTFGHPEGDRVLRLIGQVLRESLRGEDVAARYGGEEFSILLPQTASAEAETIAERIREKVAATDFQNRPITISIGVATCHHVESVENLVEAADRALYDAKRRGRNRVQVYEKLGRDFNVQKK